MIHPEQYSQNSDDSVVDESGQYDFTRLSLNELKTITKVLLTVYDSDKYPKYAKSLGFVNEAYSIVYKPRYILHEMIVQIYANSNEPLDILAVAFAYRTKGSFGRKKAIEYFEKYFKNSNETIHDMAQKYFFDVTEPFFSYHLSELYERECCFEKALMYANKAYDNRIKGAPVYPLRVGEVLRKIDISQCVHFYESIILTEEYNNIPIFSQKLSDAKKLQSKGYVYKPRKPKVEKFDEFEYKVSIAAKKLLKRT